jgi:hypothetical protein
MTQGSRKKERARLSSRDRREFRQWDDMQVIARGVGDDLLGGAPL